MTYKTDYLLSLRITSGNLHQCTEDLKQHLSLFPLYLAIFLVITKLLMYHPDFPATWIRVIQDRGKLFL